MKQHITLEQLNKLSDKGKEKLRDWWKPEEGDLFTDGDWYESLIWTDDSGDEAFYRCRLDNEKKAYLVDVDMDVDGQDAVYHAFPLLSIGQMIEFLEDSFDRPNISSVTIQDCGSDTLCCTHQEWDIDLQYSKTIFNAEELCDALWEAVKGALNNGN